MGRSVCLSINKVSEVPGRKGCYETIELSTITLYKAHVPALKCILGNVREKHETNFPAEKINARMRFAN